MKITLLSTTPKVVADLVSDLLEVLKRIGIPVDGTPRRIERMAKACLAVGNIKTSFKNATFTTDPVYMRTRDIIVFENEHYGENISSGSYDDIRRKDLKLLVEAGVVVSSSSTNQQAVNNPSRGYVLDKKFIELIHSYGSTTWETSVKKYLAERIALIEELKRLRDLQQVPVTLPNGKILKLSYGSHNSLQKAIIEEFLPRFGFGAMVLYIGDTQNKLLHIETDKLNEIGFFTLEHEELPDVIAYSAEKNLLYLIEAYHSTGEWDEIRLRRILLKLKKANCSAIPVFFTAFETKTDFRKKAKDIAWETEVWIADNPDHLVHFNGHKFLEIHK